ncbi:MAG: AmmeMemoRadiSam system radical SAM enzyme [Deltaproteobacteria bacterium]|nr:AmmeMemoRadiSam system radical SAM enzyme [Deltaproteobacteria bacterium]
MKKKALLYETLEDGKVRCVLCAHTCVIAPGKKGICGVRVNEEGTLYTLVYGTIIAENVDPIEKKPLFHILPGSRSYSIATVGCNFQCTFCQNSDISQMPRDQNRIVGKECTPSTLVEHALQSGSKTIAYTYTEPTVFFELAYDTAKMAHDKDIRNVFVTNGYMTADMLDMLSPYLDGANVDLKSFSNEFYKKYCGARLQPVLDSLRRMKDLGIWLEITTLLIPGLNDSDEELADIARYIHSLGDGTPWHISRFHPQYRLLNIPPTPVETLHRARRCGIEAGLKYVYTGNVPGDEGENTYCHHCGNLLIERYGFRIGRINIKNGACVKCGTAAEGIWGI